MKVTEFENVTRITVVFPDGTFWEKYGAFPKGVDVHLQDDDRTMKIFPRD